MYKFFTSVFVVLLIFGKIQGSETIIEENPMLMQVANELPARGVLQKTKEGAVYLAVEDAWIHRLFPLIQGQELKINKPKGAQIPVISAEEVQREGIKKIAEIGQQIPFEILYFGYRIPGIESKPKTEDTAWWESLWPFGKSERPPRPPKNVKIWYLVINAPGLEQIRQKYKLSPKKAGHDFTITLAVATRREQLKYKILEICPVATVKTVDDLVLDLSFLGYDYTRKEVSGMCRFLESRKRLTWIPDTRGYMIIPERYVIPKIPLDDDWSPPPRPEPTDPDLWDVDFDFMPRI